MLPKKRTYYRLAVESPLVFKIIRGKNPEEMSPPLKGMVKDISVGGLQFGTNVVNHEKLFIFNEFEMRRDEEFKSNFLLLKFSLPGEEKPCIVYCQPQWYGQGDLVDPFEYNIGAKYFQGTKEDLVRLRNYIQEHGDKNDLQTYVQKRKERERKEQLPGKIDGFLQQKYALASIPLRYKIISGQDGRQTRSQEAETRNISVSGLCARVEAMDIDDLHMVFDETPVKRNTIVLEIFIPGEEKPLPAIGEVRWFERAIAETRYHYNVGIRYLKIAEKDKHVIAKYIDDKPTDVTSLKSPQQPWRKVR